MAITTGILPEGMGLSPVGNPLQIKTASPSLASPLKQVRRKESFMHRADSSEDYPSPHESIFEAFYFSASNSDESNSRIELITLYPYGAPNDENRGPLTPPVRNPMNDVQFLYGHGTVLETIVEQKTGRTNRTVSRTKSLDNLPNFPFLNHRDSFILAKSPRRKQSFSLDDLALINRYYHEACATIERETCKPPPLVVPEIYAQPKKPLHAPPNRPATPPGLPSWTAAQSIPPRGRLTYTPARQNRFQRLFGLPASRVTLSSRVPAPPGVATTSQDRVTSAPIRGRIAPRFRPPRSVYGPLDQHPFLRAPVARVVTGSPSPTTAQAELALLPPSTAEPGMAEFRRQKSRRRRLIENRVRFTPSATARDSEALALQSAIESTSANAMHPLTPIQAFLQPDVEPTPGDCPHRRNRLSKIRSESRANSSSRNTTPPSIGYATLASDSPTRAEHFLSMGPRQSLSPVMSGITASSSSPYLDALDFEDVRITPTPTATPEVDTRVSSAHSTVPLMSGTVRQSLRSTPDLIPEPQVFTNTDPDVKPQWCWRCKFDKGCKIVDRWWVSSVSFVCFFCCGFGVDEDESVAYPGRGVPFNRYAAGLTGDSASPRSRALGPRRVALEQSSGRF